MLEIAYGLVGIVIGLVVGVFILKNIHLLLKIVDLHFNF